MNLREDKHCSYGVRSSIVDAIGQRPFLVVAPGQRDKTRKAVQELSRELKGMVGSRLASAEELAKAQKDETVTLADR